MNWNFNNIKPLTISLKKEKYKIDDEAANWDKIKKEVLLRDDYTCVFCGGKYKKYMFCVRMDKTLEKNNIENLVSCCKLCFICSHFNCNFLDETVLCYSKLDQIEIIRKTVDYIITHKTVPSVEEIDKNAKIINISLYKYLNLIDSLQKTPKITNNLKIFFTKQLDISFIGLTYDNAEDTFIIIDSDTLENENILYIQPKMNKLDKIIVEKLLKKKEYQKKIDFWTNKIKQYEQNIRVNRLQLKNTEIEYSLSSRIRFSK